MTSESDILEDILKNQKPIDVQIQSAKLEVAALNEKRKKLQSRIKQLNWDCPLPGNPGKPKNK